MLEQQRRPVRCGKITVDFIKNKYLERTPTQQITVRTGYLNISTPEGTAMDLLKFVRKSGGLNHIATVLTELIEVINPDKLLDLAKRTHSIGCIQRLGYLLEIIDPIETNIRDQCVDLLQSYIQSQTIRSVLLNNHLPKNDFPTHPIWKVIQNTKVESDI